MTTQYRRGTGADRHDACHALIALDAAADARLDTLFGRHPDSWDEYVRRSINVQ